jgi:hypothetical protein
MTQRIGISCSWCQVSRIPRVSPIIGAGTWCQIGARAAAGRRSLPLRLLLSHPVASFSELQVVLQWLQWRHGDHPSCSYMQSTSAGPTAVATTVALK